MYSNRYPHPFAAVLAATLLAVAPLANSAQTPSPSAVTPLSRAQWIAATPDGSTPFTHGSVPEPPPGLNSLEPLPLFRRAFTPRGKVAGATLYVSGLGQFEAHINGRNVTRAVLTPGWSDYARRIYYDTYDVTPLLTPGENAVGIMLGNGMYNVESAADRYTKFRGSFGQLKLILELRLKYADGTTQSIVSDAAWKTAPGPITYSNIYGGEDYDARRDLPGWDASHFDEKSWSSAIPVASPGGQLVPETIPPLIANDTYTPVAITHPKPGITVYDLGQNMAGWPELEATGVAGTTVRLLPGELLDPSGLITQHSMNASPKNPDRFSYTLRGGTAPELWHPRFSYSSFRYLQVETQSANPEAPAPTLKLAGRFVHDDVAVDGRFTSSSDLFNSIHTLIDRAILSNMYSVLTDCPHREKLGWIEQTHLAAASLMFNYNLASLYTKLAADMRDDQTPAGLIPDHVPEYPTFPGDFRDSPEWGAAVVLSPWAAYQFYGDLSLLRAEYPAMQRYAAYLGGKANHHLLLYGLGDWYDIGPRPPGRSQLTSAGITASSTYFQLLTALARIATLLNHPADTATYTAEAAAVQAAFNARFFHLETGQYDTGSQTANAMPLAVGLVPEDRRAAVLANLVADIHAHADHLTSGEIGFHYVVRVLTDNDRSDVLYAMLTRTDKPSYGDQLAHGATTLTEAWDAYPASSQNHFMLGHAEEWFYRGLAGIDLDLSQPRTRQLTIHPAVPGDLASASATYRSSLGNISSAWVRTGDTVVLEITIPAAATIALPSGFTRSVTIDGRASTDRSFTLKAGTYHIQASR